MGAHEGAHLGHHRRLELGRRRITLDDPAVKPLIFLVDQPLELVQFRICEGRRNLIGKRTQHHVGLAKAPPPGAELNASQPLPALRRHLLRGHFAFGTRVDFGHKNPCPAKWEDAQAASHRVASVSVFKWKKRR